MFSSETKTFLYHLFPKWKRARTPEDNITQNKILFTPIKANHNNQRLKEKCAQPLHKPLCKLNEKNDYKPLPLDSLNLGLTSRRWKISINTYLNMEFPIKSWVNWLTNNLTMHSISSNVTLIPHLPMPRPRKMSDLPIFWPWSHTSSRISLLPLVISLQML